MKITLPTGCDRALNRENVHQSTLWEPRALGSGEASPCRLPGAVSTVRSVICVASASNRPAMRASVRPAMCTVLLFVGVVITACSGGSNDESTTVSVTPTTAESPTTRRRRPLRPPRRRHRPRRPPPNPSGPTRNRRSSTAHARSRTSLLRCSATLTLTLIHSCRWHRRDLRTSLEDAILADRELGTRFGDAGTVEVVPPRSVDVDGADLDVLRVGSVWRN